MLKIVVTIKWKIAKLKIQEYTAVGLKISFAYPEPAAALANDSAWLPRSGSAVQAQCRRLK
jgi:hypothetical protein